MYFGSRQVTSAANGVILHAMEVPRVAKAKDAEAKKTPARDLEVHPSSRTPFKRPYGFQYASPYIFIMADDFLLATPLDWEGKLMYSSYNSKRRVDCRSKR